MDSLLLPQLSPSPSPSPSSSPSSSSFPLPHSHPHLHSLTSTPTPTPTPTLTPTPTTTTTLLDHSQSLNSNFNFDNIGYDYQDEPNENLICPICRNPFVDPVMCESSDHIFCRLCLIRALEHSNTCPIDRLPLSLSLVVPAPKIIIKLVDELLVRCPYRAERACQFVCHRDLIAAHVNSNVCRPVHPIPPCSASSPIHHPPSIHSPPPSSNPPPCQSPSSSIQTRCPYERFGCPYLGPASQLSTTHLSPPRSDTAICRFAPVAPLLDAYTALELRNADLRAQLAHVLAQRDELSAVAASSEARSHELWRALNNSSPALSPIGAVAGCMSPLRRSSDSALHTSRMNYDGVNGGRLAGAPQGQLICAPGSPAVRVSSFVRRGELVTPADEHPQRSLKRTAPPKILTWSTSHEIESVRPRQTVEGGQAEAGLRKMIGDLVGAMYTSLEKLEGGGSAVEGEVRDVLGRMAEVWGQIGNGDFQTRDPECLEHGRSVVAEEGTGVCGGCEVGSSGASAQTVAMVQQQRTSMKL